MPPFDPLQTPTMNMHMNQRQQQHQQQYPPQQTHNCIMYSGYGAYAPPVYHGHTGYTQTVAACPPPPAAAGWGWSVPGYAAAAAALPPPPPHDGSNGTTPTATAGTTTEPILEPHDNDVLFGRGGKNNQHVGNERLRDLARSVRDRYKKSTKKGKSNMSRELVQQIRELDPPGRFLKRNPVTSDWEDVGDDIAREKVSQVLRDAVSEWIGPKAQAKEKVTKDPKDQDHTNTNNHKSPPNSRTSSPNRDRRPSTPPPSTVPSPPSPDPASTSPMPSVQVPVPAITARTVTITDHSDIPSASSTSPSPTPPDADTHLSLPLRSRSDTADSDFPLGDIDEISIAESTDSELDLNDLNSDSSNSGISPNISNANNNNRRFRPMPMPVQHVPFQSFRRKNKMNFLDRYSNMSMGISDMSITSQLSTRTLESQISSKHLMSQGAKQMSSRTLSSRTLSSRQLSSRQLSARGLLSQQQRKNYLDMMGDSMLSLESLSICDGSSRQPSRKNILMDQYMNMDMGLSDFSLGSFADIGDTTNTTGSQPIRVHGHGPKRPSVIIEGDLEELSEHESSAANLNVKPEDLLDLYNAAGVGTSFSNMTVNTLGTFSGHSRMSKGLYSTGNSMRLESGHTFAQGPNDLQLDMLDDELFDEMDVLDDADEFSSDFI